jgi:transcriptional regulator with XRE-family HTH domain
MKYSTIWSKKLKFKRLVATYHKAAWTIKKYVKTKSIRELQNLTQEEVAERSGISVRTFSVSKQVKIPKDIHFEFWPNTSSNRKGVAHPAIAETKEDNINELPKVDYTKLKLINLSTILLYYYHHWILLSLYFNVRTKTKNVLVKQLISVQILWTIIAPIVFILGIFLKLGHQFTIIP